MCYGRALVLGLLAGLLGGCAPERALHPTAWLEHFRPNQGPSGPDVVQLEVALIERPPNDPYLSQDLWKLVDEHAVPPEREVVLNDNGFRAGKLGGAVPGELLDLLRSERSCANPRRMLVRGGRPAPLVLGPSLASCTYQVEKDGQPADVSLEQARCLLVVTPTLTEDGQTRLRFTPQVEHGASSWTFRPAHAVSADWVMQEQRPTETYPSMAWEVAVAPDQYVVVGGLPDKDKEQTLGHLCFVRPDEAPRGVQRLLVVRTTRTPAREASPPGAQGEHERGHRSTPLARQATLSAVRGRAP